MNFEGITHFFQIPLSWFKKVNRLLYTHVGFGLIYDKDAEDGPLLSVNADFFASADHDHNFDYYQKINNGTGLLYNNNGSLSLKQYGTTANDVAQGNHTHGQFGHFHSDGKFTWTSTATPIKVLVTDSDGNLFAVPISAVAPAPDMSGFITRAELDPSTVLTTNDLNPSTVITTNDLDPSTVLTTNDLDPSTVLTTNDLNPSTVLKTSNLDTNGGSVMTTTNGFNGNGPQVMLTDVNWNGVSLTKTTKTLTFTNGQLTAVGNDSQTTIDTPTKITWN